ncbi:MAG: peptidoglycan DD-metalloendopeptidase family protein [Cytophagaceae bacterium]|nr:peptidoglycan DD-metalloendopeptidase family protein [Cytophagaceae bacterium]
MLKLLKIFCLVGLLAFALIRCTNVSFPKVFQSASDSVEKLFVPASPRDTYEKGLRRAKLDKTTAGQAWLDAGERALNDSLVVGLPFRETGVFPLEIPLAYSYRVNVPAGRRLVARVSVPKRTDTRPLDARRGETKPDTTFRMFVDLFELKDNGKPKRVSFAQNGEAISRESTEETTFLLRVQPQLQQRGQFMITLENQPLLSFPVAGKKYENLISFWGAARDGGQRLHEGIDVAAPRGTPVVAAADGIVSQVTTNRLGGLVIYQQDTEHDLTLYYAHLDRQLTTPGQRVKRGDTLGLVGNTGNAVTTGPHLHFGVYQNFRGATDPLPYVDTRGSVPAPVTANTTRLGGWMRTLPSWIAFRKSPRTSASAALSLPKNTVLRPLAATQNWYRVALPDGTQGYLQAAQVQHVGQRISKRTLTSTQPLLAALTPQTDTLDVLTVNERVNVLGQFGGYQLVETPDRNGRLMTGWMRDGK